MSLPCHVRGLTDAGRLRQANEDRFVIEDLPGGSTLIVVCDGLGGHNGGQVASEVGVGAIVAGIRAREAMPPPQALFEALAQAHEAVRREALARSLVGMATTAVVALVNGAKAWVGWVGDSRLYQMREGRVVEKTADHTKVQRLIGEGTLSPAEAAIHPEAHVLERALGGTGDVTPEVWNEPLDLQSGDALLLCTDGLHDMLSDGMLHRLMEGQDAEGAARALVERANQNGGHDNVTAVVAVLGAARIPMLPDLEDTQSGNRTSSSSSGESFISRLFRRGDALKVKPREPRAVLHRPGATEVPLWATAVVAIGMLAAGLAWGLRCARAHPTQVAPVVSP
jgi:PPM family protein phosphatase